MRKILILLVLISMGLTSAALADGSRGDRGDRGNRADRSREEVRVEHDSRHYGRHDRGQKYQHWQKRMHQLRKEVRHERRADQRRDQHSYRHLTRHEVRHERHHGRRMVPVVSYRQAYAPRIFSNLVIRIPLNW